MSPIWYYAIFLYLGSFAMLILGGIALLRRRSVVTIYFFLITAFSAVYSFGYAMEVTRKVAYSIMMWNRFQYMALPFITSFLLIFIVHFISAGKRVPSVLIIVPVLFSLSVMVIRQTDPYHGLYYSAMSYVEYGNLLLLEASKGPWYWALAGWNALCLLSSAALIGVYLVRAPRSYRGQSTWLLVGTLIPVIPYFVYMSGVVPFSLDINPAAMSLASAAFYIAIIKHSLFTLVPVSRERLVETMAEAVFVLDGANRIADANPAACRAFGKEDTDPLGLPLAEAFPLLSGLGEQVLRVESRSRIWEMSRIGLKGKRGDGEGFLVVGHDVTERVGLVETLEKMTREDMLTGLLNRHSWDRAVNMVLSDLARHGRFGSIIYLDLDHFKDVNDRYGHAVGDSVLQTLASVLKEGVRGPDLVGRYGGEEFVIFLPETGPETALEVAERLRMNLMKSSIAGSGPDVTITGSFGVAGELVVAETGLEDLLSRADQAMYRSKDKGRNCVTLYTGSGD
jgi:diguanylate cyclase (GGDEF)-like protein